MTRISKQYIKKLQQLLKEQTSKDYTDEEAQAAGLAIMRFVVVKRDRKRAMARKTKPGSWA